MHIQLRVTHPNMLEQDKVKYPPYTPCAQQSIIILEVRVMKFGLMASDSLLVQLLFSRVVDSCLCSYVHGGVE